MPSNVEATASDGNVWLTGTVGYGFQRANAEQTIGALTGVRNITNDIEIFSDLEAADVTTLVQGALDRYALIGDDSDVAVDASDGTITLTGLSSGLRPTDPRSQNEAAVAPAPCR